VAVPPPLNYPDTEVMGSLI